MDYLLLHGGTDISTNIYGQTPNPKTQRPDVQRDEEELFQIDKAIEWGMPIIGVCRGAQLLTAYSGGSLYQHVELKPMSTITLQCSDGVERQAAVDHHQVMNPNSGVMLAWQNIPQGVKAYKESLSVYDILKQIPQVIHYPKLHALAIQPHPEWMQKDSEFVLWINNLCKTLLGVKANVF